MERALRIARCVGAVGFIVARWLLGVCNIPAVCGWLAVASPVFAAVYLAAFRARPGEPGATVLGRPGAWLLALTSAVNLASIVLDVSGPERFAWLVDGLDLLAWAWVLYAALATARWLSGSEPALPVGNARPVGPHHLVLSTFVVVVIALQVAALFKDRPTFWPFIDYPLYSAAQRTAVRAVHYRLYGLPAQDTSSYVEISADDLGMSWFVYHTQLIPRLFDRPWQVSGQLRRALEDAGLASFQRIESERTVFVLTETGITAFPERRLVRIEPTAGGFETRQQERAGAATAADTRTR